MKARLYNISDKELFFILGGTMKLFRAICVVALVLGLTVGAYAGTQSVKISGDLTVRSLFRGDYDFDRNHDEAAASLTALPGGAQMLTAPGSNDWENYFMTTTEVQIDADLTDNVSAVIRLVNQRDWNRNTDYADAGLGRNTYQQNVGLGLQNDDEFNVNIDLAYVELKEFLYSPLTLRVGRQDIWFGKGFIIGRNQQNPSGTISAPEYTAIESFDAIRVTLDYDPWTIDGIAAKAQEGNIASEDDVSLFGVNIGYIFDSYNAEMEAYWFWKNDANTIQPTSVKDHNTIHTLGMRGSADPIENWTVAVEGALQVGDYVGYVNQANDRSRVGFAVDAGVECRHFKEQYTWKPVIGLEYIFYSGDDETNPNEIREFYGQYYWSAQGLRTLATGNNPEDSRTNQHQAIVAGSLQPTDSLTFDARYIAFWNAEKRSYTLSSGVTEERDGYVGSEVDLELTWDYTEDVSFSLLTAWFLPGDTYEGAADDAATDIVGTMKLSF